MVPFTSLFWRKSNSFLAFMAFWCPLQWTHDLKNKKTFQNTDFFRVRVRVFPGSEEEQQVSKVMPREKVCQPHPPAEEEQKTHRQEHQTNR